MPKSNFDFNSSIKEYLDYKSMGHNKSSYDLYKYISFFFLQNDNNDNLSG